MKNKEGRKIKKGKNEERIKETLFFFKSVFQASIC